MFLAQQVFVAVCEASGPVRGSAVTGPRKREGFGGELIEPAGTLLPSRTGGSDTIRERLGGSKESRRVS